MPGCVCVCVCVCVFVGKKETFVRLFLKNFASRLWTGELWTEPNWTESELTPRPEINQKPLAELENAVEPH